MKIGQFLLKNVPPQSEAKVPFKVDLPLKLRNFVSGKSRRTSEKGCLHEFTLVIVCLEKNDYQNQLCSKEVDNYNECFRNYLTTMAFNKKAAMDGKLTPGARKLQYRQVNNLLKKYPIE